MQTLPEPWLRGPISGVDPLIAPILYAFEQAREDLAVHTAALTARLPHPAHCRQHRSAHFVSATPTTFRKAVNRATRRTPVGCIPRGLASSDGFQLPPGRSDNPRTPPRQPQRPAGSRPQASANHRDWLANAHRRTYPAPRGPGHQRRETRGRNPYRTATVRESVPFFRDLFQNQE